MVLERGWLRNIDTDSAVVENLACALKYKQETWDGWDEGKARERCMKINVRQMLASRGESCSDLRGIEATIVPCELCHSLSINLTET